MLPVVNRVRTIAADDSTSTISNVAFRIKAEITSKHEKDKNKMRFNSLISIYKEIFEKHEPGSRFEEIYNMIVEVIRNKPFVNVAEILIDGLEGLDISINTTSSGGLQIVTDISDISRTLRSKISAVKTPQEEALPEIRKMVDDYLSKEYGKTETQVQEVQDWLNGNIFDGIGKQIGTDVFDILSVGQFRKYSVAGMMDPSDFKTEIRNSHVIQDEIKKIVNGLIWNAIKAEYDQLKIGVAGPTSYEEASKQNKDHSLLIIDKTRFIGGQASFDRVINILKEYGMDEKALSITGFSFKDRSTLPSQLPLESGLEADMNYDITLTVGDGDDAVSEVLDSLEGDEHTIVRDENELLKATHDWFDKNDFHQLNIAKTIFQRDIIGSSQECLFTNIGMLLASDKKDFEISEDDLFTKFGIKLPMLDKANGDSYFERLVKTIDPNVAPKTHSLKIKYSFDKSKKQFEFKVYLDDSSVESNLIGKFVDEFKFNVEEIIDDMSPGGSSPLTISDGYGGEYILTKEEWEDISEMQKQGKEVPQWFLYKFTNLADIKTKFLADKGIDLADYVIKFSWSSKSMEEPIAFTIQEKVQEINDLLNLPKEQNAKFSSDELKFEDVGKELREFIGALKVARTTDDGALIETNTDGTTALSLDQLIKSFKGIEIPKIGKNPAFDTKLIISNGGETKKLDFEFSYEINDLTGPAFATRTIIVHDVIELDFVGQKEFDAAKKDLREYAETAKQGFTSQKIKDKIDGIVDEFVNDEDIISDIALHKLTADILDEKLKAAKIKMNLSEKNSVPKVFQDMINSGAVSEEISEWIKNNGDIVQGLLDSHIPVKEILKLLDSEALREGLPKLSPEGAIKAVKALRDTSNGSKYAFFGAGVGLGVAAMAGAGVALTTSKTSNKINRLKKTKTRIKNKKIMVVISLIATLLMTSSSIISFIYFFIDKGGF